MLCFLLTMLCFLLRSLFFLLTALCLLLTALCFLFQLDLITDLLGTPPLSAMASACEGARAHILRGPHKPVSPPPP